MSNRSQSVSEPPRPEAQADEHRELQAVAASLENSSRLLQLVTYIGEKYFQGETDKLREYEIATEVFGRSKTTFDAGEDAIVRVEAHRLRKRLKEYYENGGKDHRVQLTIPPGSYVPVFTRRAVPVEAPKPEAEPSPRRIFFYIIGATALILMVAALYFVFRGHSEKPTGAVSSAAVSIPSPAAAALTNVPVRILAGYYWKAADRQCRGCLATGRVLSLRRNLEPSGRFRRAHQRSTVVSALAQRCVFL